MGNEKEKRRYNSHKDHSELIGKRFGHWLVLSYIDGIRNKRGVCEIRYTCLCDCGTKKDILKSALLQGKTKSCGCMRNDRGEDVRAFNASKLKDVYFGMMQRCYYPNAISYKNYGGRGITVCDEWKGREGRINFYHWSVDNGYSEGLTLERIDNDKNYSPSNCRWATKKEQSNNTRRNHIITFNGETKTLIQWANQLGFTDGGTLLKRLKYGWTLEETLTIKKTTSHGRSRYIKEKNLLSNINTNN